MTHYAPTTIGTAPTVWASRDQTTATSPNAYVMRNYRLHKIQSPTTTTHTTNNNEKRNINVNPPPSFHLAVANDEKSEEYNIVTHSASTNIGTAPTVWASRDQTTDTCPNAYIIGSLQNYEGNLLIVEM
eukprot:4646026-Ditylum_brightwellii.AAC.1